MIDEKKLIEELREYEDALYDSGELAMMSGVRRRTFKGGYTVYETEE